jgi:hypothetical protein
LEDFLPRAMSSALLTRSKWVYGRKVLWLSPGSPRGLALGTRRRISVLAICE